MFYILRCALLRFVKCQLLFIVRRHNIIYCSIVSQFKFDLAFDFASFIFKLMRRYRLVLSLELTLKFKFADSLRISFLKFVKIIFFYLYMTAVFERILKSMGSHHFRTILCLFFFIPVRSWRIEWLVRGVRDHKCLSVEIVFWKQTFLSFLQFIKF